MEIYSVDSTELRENKQNAMAKYYPKWDWKPGTSVIPATHATPELVPL